MMEWKWTKEQLEPGRIARARKVELSNVVVNIPLSECHAECVSGSTGEVYHVSLQDCTCRDFTVGKKPCKHMIALAIQAGILNSNGMTMEQAAKSFTDELAVKVALASGYYHVYHRPIMADAEYDALKYELWKNSDLLSDDEIAVKDQQRLCTNAAKELIAMPLKDFIAHITNIRELTLDEFARLFAPEDKS